MTAILTVQQVEKSFGSRSVLKGVSCAVHDHDRVGLVGLNGAGKSTLLRLMVARGEPSLTDPRDQPDAGLITIQRGLTLEYVPQEPVLVPARTVEETVREGLRARAAVRARLEALEETLASLSGARLDAALEEQARLHEHILALGGWHEEHELRSIAHALKLPPLDRAVDTLSGGERRRVALARALIARPALLALDEPTNHLDAQTVEWLEERLREHPFALLLVTHDRYFLDRVATRIFELDRGALYAYEGGYTRFLEQQGARLAEEEGHKRARELFIRRELDWIRRKPEARRTKAQARVERFEAAVGAAQRAREERLSGPMTLRLPTGGRLGKTIVELRGLGRSIRGDNGDERTLFRDLNLVMKPGDRIGIVGPNGVGKTTLVRTLLGLVPPDAGEVVLGVNTRPAYLDQARAALNDQATVLEHVADGNDHVFLEEGPVHVRTFLRMLLFDDRFADTPVGTLSGGERNRVQLARLLRQGGNLLVLDEPTNDLDLQTLGVLEEALAEFPGCALIVSHDRWFLDKVATGILAFEGEGRVTFYEGDYSSYLARRPPLAEGGAPERVPAEAPVRADPPKPQVGSRKASWRERQELSTLPATIEAAEARVAALEAELADPLFYKKRAAEVPTLTATLDQLRAEVDRLYARWAELDALAT